MIVRLEALAEDLGRWPKLQVEGTQVQIEYFLSQMYVDGNVPLFTPSEPTYYCGAQYCEEPECGTHGINYKLWREL